MCWLCITSYFDDVYHLQVVGTFWSHSILVSSPATPEQLLDSLPEGPVLHDVDDGIQTGITDGQHHTEVKIGCGEIHGCPQVERQVYEVDWCPADDVSDDHKQESFLEFLGHLELPHLFFFGKICSLITTCTKIMQ